MPIPRSRTAGDFESLFDYDRWANRRLVEVMKNAGPVPPRAPNLLMHLLRAQDVWHKRIEDGNHADVELWIEASLEDCAERVEKTDHRWQDLIGALSDGDLDKDVSYKNSEGTAFETPLREVLSHVVNHGTHHRGQIALVLRENGVAPPPTDYIFYVRDH